MLIVTVMLAVIFGMILFFTVNDLEEQSIQMLQGIREERFQPEGLNGPQHFERIAYILVKFDRQGCIQSISNRLSDEIDEKTILEITERVLEKGERADILEDVSLRYLRSVTPFGEQIVFADAAREKDFVSGLIRTCSLIGLLSFCVFLAISIFLSGWAVKPVEKAWNQQRQFVADASHELKTPLTVIMTNAELLQNPDYPPEERNRSIAGIASMAYQMRGLVDGMLNLARVDNNALKMVFSELDLSMLVTEELLPFEPVLYEKGLALDSEVEPGIWIIGSDSHLRQVLSILLDNAGKYSTVPGTVEVNLKRQGGSCVLSVTTPGKEISSGDLKNIFKRFYRIDKARPMDQSYGLGLSIAESLVNEHKGKIWAESMAGRNSFYVQLPAILH